MPKSVIHILAIVLLIILGISTRFIFLIDGESILPNFSVAGIIAYKMMNKPSWGKLLITGITAGVVFYIISNFGVWMTGNLYPKTFAGLIMSYEAGLPFFRNTILGNVFYSFVLFGLYEFVIAPLFSMAQYKLLSTQGSNL